MLGDQLGEEHGQITGMRVLASEGAPKVEVSFQATGTLAGVEVSDMGTYVSVARPDGTLYGEGQGVTMTPDGGMASWRGQGRGRFTGPGAVSWRGAIYFDSASPQFARLTGCAVLYEYETDADGKADAKYWEWK